MQAELNSSGYLHWIKTSRSLLYLKRGIEKFCDEKGGELHTDILNNVQRRVPSAATSKCTQCTCQKNKNWSLKCKANICNVWLEEILRHHVYQPLPKVNSWANSDPRAWPSDPWAVAKLFQPYGCVGITKAEDSDCAGLLSLMKDCSFFHTFITNTALLQEIKDIRNACIHSGSLEISDADMKKGLKLMISLLEEPGLKKRPECIEAKEKIEHLRDCKLNLSKDKELERQAINNMFTEVQHDMNKLYAEQKYLQSCQGSTEEECRENKERLQTLSLEITEMSHPLDDIKEKLRKIDETLADVSHRQDVTEKLAESAVLGVGAVFLSIGAVVLGVWVWMIKNNDIDTHDKYRYSAYMIIAFGVFVLLVGFCGRCGAIRGIKRLLGLREEEQRRKEKHIAHIQSTILDLYEKHCQCIPIYPLRPSLKKRIDDLYVKPSIVVADPRGKYKHDKQGETSEQINRVQDIFYSGDKLCKDIYISGEMGYGKTSLCEHLLSLWYKYHRGPRPLTENQAFMGSFIFLFHISLREANREFKENYCIETIIKSQLQLSDCNVAKLMSDNQCLIILDGLDELTQTHGSANARFGSQHLPQRLLSDRCVYVTTSRPFKLESLACELEGQINRQLEIESLGKHSQTELANNVLTLLNEEYSKDKSADTFIADMQNQNMTKYLETPVICMLMLGLWFDDKPIGNSQCGIYSNMIEKQLELTATVRELLKDEHIDDTCQDQLPYCFTNKPYCQRYKSLLFKVAKLAFERIFDKTQENSFIFDHNQIEICGLSNNELQQLLDIGILTQHKVCGGVTEELKSVTFLHKSHQEFFCAIHLSTKCQRREVLEEFCDLHLRKLLDLDNVFIFVCGLNNDIAAEMFAFFMDKVSEHGLLDLYLYIRWCVSIERLQRVIMMGAEEARKNHKSDAALKLQHISVDCKSQSKLFACDLSALRSVLVYGIQPTTWPTSLCIERMVVLTTDLTSCGNFTSNISTNKMSELHLQETTMTHAQLDRLFESISSSENLCSVMIVGIYCSTHEITDDNCIIKVDFSRHVRLQKLKMLRICVNEISSLRLGPKLENLIELRLSGMVIPCAGFKQAMETLRKSCSVYLGHSFDIVKPGINLIMCERKQHVESLKVKGSAMARAVLNNIDSSRVVKHNCVEDSEDICIIKKFEFTS